MPQAPIPPHGRPPRKPLQARSQRTLDSIVRAADALLQLRDWNDIGIQEICKRARCTTGAFYARFTSKDDLLPYIYATYDAQLAPRWQAILEQEPWDRMSLGETVARCVSLVVQDYRDRRPLLRAIGLFARLNPGAIDGELRVRRAALHDLPLRVFARHRAAIRHPDPEAAIRTGFFIVAATARDKILFGDAPHASVTPLSDAALITELTRALHAYLVF